MIVPVLSSGTRSARSTPADHANVNALPSGVMVAGVGHQVTQGGLDASEVRSGIRGPFGVVKTPRLKGSVYPVATTAGFESASALSTIVRVSGSGTGTGP